MKLRNFWVIDNKAIGLPEYMRYEAVEDRTRLPILSPYIYVREVSSALDAAYVKCVKALEFVAKGGLTEHHGDSVSTAQEALDSLRKASE